MILQVRNSDGTVMMAHLCFKIPGTSAGIIQKTRSWKEVGVSVSLFPLHPPPTLQDTQLNLFLHLLSPRFEIARQSLLTVWKPQVVTCLTRDMWATGALRKNVSMNRNQKIQVLSKCWPKLAQCHFHHSLLVKEKFTQIQGKGIQIPCLRNKHFEEVCNLQFTTLNYLLVCLITQQIFQLLIIGVKFLLAQLS